jgi:hypothetical protein
MIESNTKVEKIEIDESELKSKRNPNFIPTKSLKARGTLSVDKPLKGADDDGQTVRTGTSETEMTPLPVIGRVFKIDGYEYKVHYINVGQNRFSAIPV